MSLEHTSRHPSLHITQDLVWPYIQMFNILSCTSAHMHIRSTRGWATDHITHQEIHSPRLIWQYEFWNRLAKTEAWIFKYSFTNMQKEKDQTPAVFLQICYCLKNRRLKWKLNNNSIKICFPVGASIPKCSIMCLKEHKRSAEGSAAEEVFCSRKDKTVNSNSWITQRVNLGGKSSLVADFLPLAGTRSKKEPKVTQANGWLKGATMNWEDIVLSSFSSPFLFVGLALLRLRRLLESSKASLIRCWSTRYTSGTHKNKSRMWVLGAIPRSCWKKGKKANEKQSESWHVFVWFISLIETNSRAKWKWMRGQLMTSNWNARF